MSDLNIYSDTVEYGVKFVIDGQVCVEINRVGIDEYSNLPIYNLQKIDEIQTLANGSYIITDIMMPSIIELISNYINKYLIFKNKLTEDSIEVKYWSTSGEEVEIPFFISDNTIDSDIDNLTKKQMEFMSIYHEFLHDNKGMIWEETIHLLQQTNYLVDFLCMLNIERKLLGVGN